MEIVKTDCRFYRGTVPCAPHKRTGVHCADCPEYDAVDRDILIIKLGATGDVIRTTPLLRRLRADHPHARIWWLTESPDVVPAAADVVLPWTLASLTWLRGVRFATLYNLDKDTHASALATELSADVKKGFLLRDNVVVPADADAEAKYLTGLFDDVSRANTKSYPAELFEMCGMRFAGERYIVDLSPAAARDWALPAGARVVGLNTGSGERWTSRRWPRERWAELARALQEAGNTVVLLGGPSEHDQNTAVAAAAGARYFGHFPLPTFAHLVAACDLVVTGVTLALHLTIGLARRVVLLNNIFNPHEFELYGLGEIVEPDRPCQCYFRPVCVNPDYRCIDHLPVAKVLAACTRQLAARP